LLAVASGASLLEGCAGISEFVGLTVNNNTIAVPLASIAKGEKNKINTGTTSWHNDILLVVADPTDYRALEMRCTHADNILSASNNGLYCTFHGSAFNLKGDVVNGPANRPLKKFRTSQENDHITIFLS
jgi:Rieske Fe-S protein